MRKWIFVLIAALASPGLVSAESPAVKSAQTDAGGSTMIDGAWVRALPPTQRMTAGYLQLTNATEASMTLVGATSNIADQVEIHTTIEVDGMMRMQQLKSVAVAAGESIEFSPGGTHLMFMGVRQMPRPGEEVKICLQLASGGEVCTVALAQKKGPQGAAIHKHHH